MATPIVNASPAQPALRPPHEVAADFHCGVNSLMTSTCTWGLLRCPTRGDMATVDSTLRGLERLMVELRQSAQEADHGN